MVTCRTKNCRTRKNIDFDGFCKKCHDNKHTISSELEAYPCGKCEMNCSDSNKAVQCEYCDTWSHIACVDINEAVYTFIKNSRGFRWYCQQCDEKVDEVVLKAASLEAKQTAMQTQIKSVTDRLVVVEKKLTGSVNKEIDTAINEKTDIERRKLNFDIV